MSRRKRRSSKKKGPPARPMVPSFRLDTNVPGHLPIRKPDSLNSGKGSEEDDLKGNLKSRFVKSSIDFAISVMHTFRAHLKAAIALALETRGMFELKAWGVDHNTLSVLWLLTGIAWVWLVLEFIQDLTGIRVKDWAIEKVNTLLI